MSNSQPTRISGTKEWSTHSVNCISGCSHNCRYCYAREMATRYRRITSADDWATMTVRPAEVSKRRRKLEGRVMFPTTHDITPEMVSPCFKVLRNLLIAGNDVLIVSKPHLSCIETLCRELRPWQSSIQFRFSIGARDDTLLGYWEPGAPVFLERVASLQCAHRQGYATSVSCEPLLDASDIAGLFSTLAPFVTDSIWIGKMNKVRVRASSDTDEAAIEQIELGQTQEAVEGVYSQMKGDPLVRWKESYKTVLALDFAVSAGLDV